MARIDQTIEKWIGWMEKIHDEIQHLVMAKDIFWSVGELVKKNKQIQKQNVFHAYLGYTYVTHALMGIRRQVKGSGNHLFPLARAIAKASNLDLRELKKRKDNSISFIRLLEELADAPEKLSRAYYRSLYKNPDTAHYADKHFDQFCDKPGDKFISRTMVEADLIKLGSTTGACEDYADRVLAHCDSRGPKAIPKFKEADAAIDTLHEFYLKYHLMLHAECLTSLQPTYQYDWKEIFDFPWRLLEQESE